jgi:hypothetical protein
VSIERDINFHPLSPRDLVMAKVVFVSVIGICAAVLFGYASAAVMSTVIGQGVFALIVGLIVLNGAIEASNLFGQSRRAA